MILSDVWQVEDKYLIFCHLAMAFFVILQTIKRSHSKSLIALNCLFFMKYLSVLETSSAKYFLQHQNFQQS